MLNIKTTNAWLKIKSNINAHLSLRVYFSVKINLSHLRIFSGEKKNCDCYVDPTITFFNHQKQQKYLEVAAVASPEGQDEAFEDQLSNLREL